MHVLKANFLALVILTGLTRAAAQTPEQARALFPGEQAVVKNYQVHYDLSVENGEPRAESTTEQEIMYLSENAGSYMSRYSFYQSSFHEVTRYKAYTLANGRKTDVKDFKSSQSISESVFWDDAQQVSFDFPGITAGAVGHLEYTTVHKNPRMLSPHYFSRFIPVLNGELSIRFPKGMSVKYLIRGNYKEMVHFTSETKRGETTYTFRVENLPKELNYPDAPDNSYYALHVIFYIERFTRDGQEVNYMSGLDDLFHLNWSFVRDINKEISPELKRITDSLVTGAGNREEKTRRIYRWVQKNIKYVAFEAGMEGFVPREASLICSRRFGDCKDMSSILTSMLTYAGVPAYYTWIGSRALPYDYTEVALPIVDNHMITTVKLDTGFLFLDGTDSYCVFGAPSGHIQGKQALIGISENEYKVIRVPEYPKEKSRRVDSTILTLGEKGITGSVAIHLTGYFAMNMHAVMSYTNQKDREDYMRRYFNRGSNKFRLNGYEIGDTGDANTFRLTGQFDLQDYSKKIASEWYLNLNLFKFFEHQEIDYPRRNSPIEQEYKSSQEYVTVLNIPEGYQVTYLPPGKSYHNSVWGFDLTYTQNKNQVILTQRYDNDRLLLQPGQFQEWNKVLENLLPLYRETISLARK